MAKEKKLEILKDLIDSEKVTEFKDIFLYIDKTDLHKLTGINYYKILRYAKDPKTMDFKDVYLIAHALSITPRQVTDLVLNQIGSKKK